MALCSIPANDQGKLKESEKTVGKTLLLNQLNQPLLSFRLMKKLPVFAGSAERMVECRRRISGNVTGNIAKCRTMLL